MQNTDSDWQLPLRLECWPLQSLSNRSLLQQSSSGNMRSQLATTMVMSISRRTTIGETQGSKRGKQGIKKARKPMPIGVQTNLEPRAGRRFRSLLIATSASVISCFVERNRSKDADDEGVWAQQALRSQFATLNAQSNRSQIATGSYHGKENDEVGGARTCRTAAP